MNSSSKQKNTARHLLESRHFKRKEHKRNGFVFRRTRNDIHFLISFSPKGDQTSSLTCSIIQRF